MFKPILIIGFRSRKNNSLFFIRRSASKYYSNNNNSTIYFQQTAASTTDRVRSTKNSRASFTARQLSVNAAKYIFKFFNNTKRLNSDDENNSSRFLIKQSNPSYNYLLKNYRHTLKGFFAHLSEKKKYLKRLKFPSVFYLYDKLLPRNIKNIYLFNLYKLKKKKNYKKRYKFLKFLNVKNLTTNLLNKRKTYFFIKLNRLSNNNNYLPINNYLKYDYFNNLSYNNLLVTSNNLKLLFNNFKLLNEFNLNRELKLRTLGIQYLLTSKNYKQKKFEKLFWVNFLKLINNNYYLPFKNVKTKSFYQKYKVWFKAKRFTTGKKKLTQPLRIKIIYSYRVNHNGLRKKKARRV